MSLSLIPVGSRITRRYYAIPTPYTIGDTFEEWDAAVEQAQSQRAELVERLTQSLGEFSTPKGIAETADAQVRIELRWEITTPDGGTWDTVVESFHKVHQLSKTIGSST